MLLWGGMSKGNAVLIKLREQLELGLYTEANAVHFLSLLRKCLEVDGAKGSFKYLNLYSNWALHSQIDNGGAIAEIIEDYTTFKNPLSFMFFKHLIDELRVFLKAKELPAAFLDDDRDRLRFLNCLVKVLHDCPLFVRIADARYRVELLPSGVVPKGSIYSINVSITPLTDDKH